MTRRPEFENELSPRIALTACLLSLRSSLLSHPAVFDGKPFTLALVVPEEFQKDYARAFTELQRAEPVLADVKLGMVIANQRGRRDYYEVKMLLRFSERVLILLDSEEGLPTYLTAAADRITKVAEIDGKLLTNAVSVTYDWKLSEEHAGLLLRYPIEDVFAALRPGRTASDAHDRLEAARATTLDAGAVRVEDLAGYGAAADWAKMVIADVSEWKAGRLSWRDVDAGVVISGPPGVGKTLFARSLARSCECSFVASSLAQWQSAGHLGDLLKAMRDTFRTAAERAPTILLLDEFDSIGDRSTFSGQNAQYSIEVVAGLLECLDGAFRREGVIVAGACNHPDRIDKALLRPGRLGKHFRLSLPDTEARKGILVTLVGDRYGKNDLDKIAAATLGFSGAELEQLVTDGRRKARLHSRAVTAGDILSCLPPSNPIDGKLRDRICIHEAGHAAAIIELDVGRLLGVAVMDSFRGVGNGGGAHFDREARLQTAEYYRNNLVVQLAGMAAEFVLFGDHLEGSGGRNGSDLQRAADTATSMVAQLGMGGVTNFLSAETFEDLDRIRRTVPSVNRRVEELLADAYKRAKTLVVKNVEFVCELAVILNAEGGVDGDRATSLFDALEKSDAE
ncbi:AAA family ATPase [Rhizobium ruizarguesonis]|uniref:AAA family ATPase n=1 Tax=Rhizobium ruizarguesonis TaxID=2081791 RepID=UPI0013EEFEE0|nr:AAA family ATPase [Rhizobium ruizarguesonis]